MQELTSKLNSKLTEIAQFEKVVAKLQETLEVSFGDDEIEKSNTQIVQQLLEHPKIITLIKAMVTLREIVKMVHVVNQMA